MARRGVAVGELEDAVIDERHEPRGVRRRRVRVDPPEVDQRIQLFDRRHTPVAEPAVVPGVERVDVRLGVGIGELVVHVQRAVVIPVGTLRPRQAGDVIEHGQPVGAGRVARLVPGELGVLAVECLALDGSDDLAGIVVEQRLTRVDHGVVAREHLPKFQPFCAQMTE